ncbi:4321_t:CDS:1, partial [Funneliformis geosporum]
VEKVCPSLVLVPGLAGSIIKTYDLILNNWSCDQSKTGSKT